MTGASALPEKGLRVLLADESRDALDGLGRILEGLGHEVMPFAVSVGEAADLIAREEPDVSLVVVDADDAHALTLITEAVEFGEGPVIAVLRQAEVDFVARAAEHGISAYIDMQSPEAVQGAIEVSLRRHREAAALTERVGQLQTALERRTLIERAKGILMERHGVDERTAFSMLREHARSTRQRVLEVAQAVNGGHPLLSAAERGDYPGPGGGTRTP